MSGQRYTPEFKAVQPLRNSSDEHELLEAKKKNPSP